MIFFCKTMRDPAPATDFRFKWRIGDFIGFWKWHKIYKKKQVQGGI